MEQDGLVFATIRAVIVYSVFLSFVFAGLRAMAALTGR